MSKKVLVVDDSVTMRNMLTVSMKEEGFEVIAAEDGVSALEVIGDNKLDLVITDINMPNMDGIELIKRLRSHDTTKYTPILVVTTEGGENTKRDGKAAGATGWIVKPFQPDTLSNAVRRVCNL